ncbi:MAG: hypothetical protein QOD44_416, partial [Solirubrobacteraceae bacterium]|nr:hypothetical protein [Solirubrobacteraceae bacterium]
MTDTTTPIACSLTGAEYRRRADDVGRFAREALLDRRRIDGGARLTFDDTADVRERLGGLVAAESACCPFLTLHFHAAGG